MLFPAIGDVEVVVLEEEALAGVPGGEGEPEPITAIDEDARGTEAVAVSLDVDLAGLGPATVALANQAGSTAPEIRINNAASRRGVWIPFARGPPTRPC